MGQGDVRDRRTEWEEKREEERRAGRADLSFSGCKGRLMKYCSMD